MSVIDSIPVEQVAVRVRNVGDKDLRGQQMRYGGAEYAIPSGGEVVMPWLAMCHFFGDPRAINIGDSDANRDTQFRRGEVERLQVHYGTYDQTWYEDVPMTTPGGANELHMDEKGNSTGLVPYQANGDKFMHPNLPRVEVFRMDNSERITTVVEDPEGDGMAPPDTSKLELATLKQQYDMMQERLDQLQSEMKFRDPAALQDIEHDPLDNIPAPAPEVGADEGAINSDAPDRIVDSLDDPEVPDVPATKDTPRRPTPKKKVT